MQTASSAKRTCKLSLSAVEKTATVFIPISLQVRMIRKAISPLFAINIFLNMNLFFYAKTKKCQLNFWFKLAFIYIAIA
jgi:hypothetical protein